MDKKVLYNRDPDWAVSKVTLVIHAFLALALLNIAFDTLIKGYPLDRIFGEEGGGTYWDLLNVILMGRMLYGSLAAVQEHASKGRPLRPIPLLIHVVWSGAAILYLIVLFTFYLDFFLVNIT
jgi:hypothetical protein